MGIRDRLEQEKARLIAAAQDGEGRGLVGRVTESLQAVSASATVQRAGSGFRSLRAMFDGDDEQALTVEGFLLRLIRAVRDDERATEHSARQLYVAARKRRRKLGLIAFGAGPLVGVANQVADLYCETATVCDVAAFHGMSLSDEQIAAHMLLLWSVTENLEEARRAVRGDPPVARILSERLLARADEQLPENLTKRAVVKGLWDVRGTVADAGRASTSGSVRTVVFTGHRTKQVIKRAEAQLGTQGLEVDDTVDPGIEAAQASLADFELTGDEHELLAAFSGSKAALARTDPSSPSYLEALETTAEAFFSHFRHTGNFAALDGAATVFGRAAAVGDRAELPQRITVRHDEWPDATVARAIGDLTWTIQHSDGQVSHISKDWSGWTGEGWPTGFTIERLDGSTFAVDEGHFGDGWQLVEMT